MLMLVPSSASEVLVALHQALLHHFHLHLENMITSILKGHSPYKVTNAQVMRNKYATSQTPLIIITDHCAPCEHSKQGLTSIKLQGLSNRLSFMVRTISATRLGKLYCISQ